MIIANDFRTGMTVVVDGRVMQVLEYHRVRSGKGGAYMRTKLRDLEGGSVLTKLFRSEEKVEQAFLEARRMQYLYREGDIYYFMDLESFEQVGMTGAELDEQVHYLKDGMEVTFRVFQGRRLAVELPDFVDAVVVKTEPGVRGDTAARASKPAVLETGAMVTVPLFINQGDVVRVDTRTGQYVERIQGG